MYIAEVAPARIRGRMVSLNQFAIVSGMVVVYFVNSFIAQYVKSQDMHAVAGMYRRVGCRNSEENRCRSGRLPRNR